MTRESPTSASTRTAGRATPAENDLVILDCSYHSLPPYTPAERMEAMVHAYESQTLATRTPSPDALNPATWPSAWRCAEEIDPIFNTRTLELQRDVRLTAGLSIGVELSKLTRGAFGREAWHEMIKTKWRDLQHSCSLALKQLQCIAFIREIRGGAMELTEVEHYLLARAAGRALERLQSEGGPMSGFQTVYSDLLYQVTCRQPAGDGKPRPLGDLHLNGLGDALTALADERSVLKNDEGLHMLFDDRKGDAVMAVKAAAEACGLTGMQAEALREYATAFLYEAEQLVVAMQHIQLYSPNYENSRVHGVATAFRREVEKHAALSALVLEGVQQRDPAAPQETFRRLERSVNDVTLYANELFEASNRLTERIKIYYQSTVSGIA